MTLPKDSRFEAYKDGICILCRIDDEGNAGKEMEKLRYNERTVGIKRYWEAMTHKLQVDRLVRVQYREWLTTEYLAVIGGRVYEIVQMQKIPDALPPSLDLSLHLARQRRYADGTV